MIKFDEFNWEKYEDNCSGDTKLTPNLSIKGTSAKVKCFSREPYAQKLFDICVSQESKSVKKDLEKGDCILINDIFDVGENTMTIELSGGLTISIDLNREKRFIQLFGSENVINFTNQLKTKEGIDHLLSQKIYAYVLESNPVKVSLWQGYIKTIKDEFMQEIENPTKAYVAKVIEANRGGFFVEVQGVEAFMPGSLAAPNKIIDFQSYVGKEVKVMIEDYLKEMNSFIVSHKKYLERIIPIKIKELSTTNKYLGVITGTSKYGIFVEFEEIFTALLHISKMDETTKTKFELREYKSGDTIEFYISEITKDNRIIATKESPEDKLNKIQKFILESKDKTIEATIAAIMKFGVIVNMGEINGLVPLKEFHKNRIMINNFIVGDKIKVIFNEFRDEKLVFRLSLNDIYKKHEPPKDIRNNN
jgi:predicted RNA-binding protein with RPS1 domain